MKPKQQSSPGVPWSERSEGHGRPAGLEAHPSRLMNGSAPQDSRPKTQDSGLPQASSLKPQASPAPQDSRLKTQVSGLPQASSLKPQASPAPQDSRPKTQDSGLPQASSLKPQASPAPQDSRLKTRVSGLPQASSLKPQASPAPQDSRLKTRVSGLPQASSLKPQASPAPQASSLKPQASPAPQASSLKPQASPASGSLPTAPAAVACIIPAYNAATTIERTLHSLQAQTLAAWHAIVVDDGSTDATADIAARFARADARIALVTKPNGGVASARNAGLPLARARYTHQLDADDWLAPDAYATLVALAQRTGHPAAAGSFDVTDDRGSDGGDTIYRQVLARDLIDRDALLAGVQLWTGAHIVRTDLAATTPYDENLIGYEDVDCWLRLAACGARWACTAAPVAFHRIRAGSLTKRCADMIACGQRVLAAHGAGAASIASLALSYATARALDTDPGASIHAADLYRHAAGPKRIAPETAAAAARFAVIYHLGLAPRLDDASSARWLPRIHAWWGRAVAERWAAPTLRAQASFHLALQLVDPAAVCDRLLRDVPAGAPIVVIAHGRNGRNLAAAALARAHPVQIRDDRYDADPAAADTELPTGATWARTDATLPPGATVILTPIDDQALAARFPGARRWSRVLAEWTHAPDVTDPAAHRRTA